MKPHPTTNRQSYFKQQILTEPNKNYKIFQSSKKKGTHEVSGHFDTIWPNFNPPTAEREHPTPTVSKTSNLRSEPMDGLKIPPKGSMSNFKSNRHRLTLHQLSNGEIKPPGGYSDEDIKSSIRAYGWSQNTSKRFHVEFHDKPTPFDPPSTLERRDQAFRR